MSSQVGKLLLILNIKRNNRLLPCGLSLKKIKETRANEIPSSLLQGVCERVVYNTKGSPFFQAILLFGLIKKRVHEIGLILVDDIKGLDSHLLVGLYYYNSIEWLGLCLILKILETGFLCI